MLEVLAEEISGTAPGPSRAPQEVLAILLTRCGCTRVLGPMQADKLPEFVEVRLMTVPGALIQPGAGGGEARRFRLAMNGAELLRGMGMALQGDGDVLPQAVYLEVLTYGTSKLLVPNGGAGPSAGWGRRGPLVTG